MPEISVIVPVYKVEKYLHRCIDSILAQTYTDFELILVDDGSPDNCGRICDEYKEKDGRIRVIHQKNGGLSAARNTGIDAAHGNWLSFIDSDDWVHPRMLELLYKSAEEHDMPVSICGYKNVEREERFSDVDFDVEIFPTENFYIEQSVNATVAWGKLYKKLCFNDLRYPIGKLHEDEFVTYKILFRFPQIVFVNAPLYFYFSNAEGIMNSKWSPKRLDAIEAIEEQLEFFCSNNCKNVIIKRANCYLWQIKDNYDMLKKSSYKSKKLQRLLKGKMRRGVKEYKNILSINIDNYPWIYDMLYPVVMSVYWRYQNILQRIKNK